MTQTPTETLVAAVPELTGHNAMDLDALLHGLSMLTLGDDRRRVLNDIKIKGFAVDDGDGDGITLTEWGQVVLTALQHWVQDTIVADAMETQPSNLRLAETALRMRAERTGATGTSPALDQLEVAVPQRLARQPGGGLSDSMWTGDERCALGGLMLREPRLVDIPPIPRSRWARWFITAEGRAALEAGATHGN